MSDEANDPLLRSLRALPVLEPDPARAARVRARGRDIFARRRRQATQPAGSSSIVVLLERALVGGLCLIYLSAVLHDVLRLRGIL
jgi:hypothetical protein